MELINELKNIGIIPVIEIEDANKAQDLAKALKDGDIPVCEITFRTDEALKAIENIANGDKDVIVGAGTILDVNQAKDAIKAGAKFIVSPGFIEEVIDYCLENDVLVIPGVSDASDMTMAVNKGLTCVKFFPSEANGGLNALKAFSSAFKTLSFIPTGGINENNYLEYLAYDKVLAIGGSFIAKRELINEGKFDEIRNNAYNAIKKLIGFELKHVGINCENEEEAIKAAKRFCYLFNLDYKAGNSSIFAGKDFECMKKMFLGKYGHICIGVNDENRALYNLAKKGVEFNEDTRAFNEDGSTKNVYIKEEIGGFAVHVMKK